MLHRCDDLISWPNLDEITASDFMPIVAGSLVSTCPEHVGVCRTAVSCGLPPSRRQVEDVCAQAPGATHQRARRGPYWQRCTNNYMNIALHFALCCRALQQGLIRHDAPNLKLHCLAIRSVAALCAECHQVRHTVKCLLVAIRAGIVCHCSTLHYGAFCKAPK